MLERFLASFPITSGTPRAIGSAVTVAGLAGSYGGCAFGDGIYRIHTATSASEADSMVAAAFPEYTSRIRCFGFDWLGRQFATDSARGLEADFEILMFEPGSGEVLQIPVALSEFHDREVVDFPDAVLAREFYRAWTASGGAEPTFGECIGYRVPLFLGGEDAVPNLELTETGNFACGP